MINGNQRRDNGAGPHEVLSHLRDLKAQERPLPTVEQVRLVVDDLRNGRPLAVTAGKPELEGWSETEVVQCVEWLGKFLARSRRVAFSGPILPRYSSMMLWAPSQDELEKMRQELIKSKGKPNKRTRSLVAALPDGVEAHELMVFIPEGWEAHEMGRDVTQSLATVVAQSITDTETMRFIDRNYRTQTSMMTAEHVYLLTWLGSHGLLRKLTELTDENAQLGALLISAWELLDRYAAEASEAIAVLTTAAEDSRKGNEFDLHALRLAATRARWVCPAEFDRLGKLLAECERNPGNVRMVELLGARLRSFNLWAKGNSVPSVPGSLNRTQVQMICDSAGLLVNEADEKAVRGELRTRLTELGLGNDLDREIGEGVRAWKLGKLPEFYTTRESRSNGDSSWASEWEKVLSEVLTLEPQ